MQREKNKRTAERRPVSKPKKKKANPLNRQEKELVAAAIVLSVVLVVMVGYKSLFSRPDIGKDKTPQHPGTEQGESSGGAESSGSLIPRVDGERKSKDFYTILILGRDTGGGGNTDTILLASYDVTNQKAAVMSIPRDTMVNVSWDVKKINSVYNAYGGGDNGINAVRREVSQLVGFEPDFQVVVEWDAVPRIVDALGGVYFDVPYNMDYHDPLQDLVIEQTKGYRLLTGTDAMQVIRWRMNDKDSPYGYTKIGDSGRMKLQQDFLKALIEQAMQPANVLKIGEIVQVFKESVKTDLDLSEILWFGKAAVSGGLKVRNVEFLTMPYSAAEVWSRSYNQKLDYLLPRAYDLLTMVNDTISPFVEPFGLDDLDIMYVNYDGSVSSTSGHVEDAQAALPPEIPVVEPDPEIGGEQTGEGVTGETETTDPTLPDIGGEPGTTEEPGATEEPGTTEEPLPETQDPDAPEAEEEPETDTPIYPESAEMPDLG
ncbi:MAG: LytR family transcriptional regulator [Ruminococcaceae bacterium]|nr:LytR family transcriptional regulator [Oscillospiraceae bacterium]